MTRKTTIGLLVAATLALITLSIFAYPRDAKDGIFYPNLGTFVPDYYKVLRERGKEGVVIGLIKGETDPSLWIGADRFPLNGRSWATHVFLRQHGTEPVYIMKTNDGKEYLRIGHHNGPEFEYIWGNFLTFEYDEPWTDAQVGTFSLSEHRGRVVYVGYDKSPTTYSVVVDDKIVAMWTHRPLVMPRFIAVGTNRDDVSRRMISYQVISDDEASLVTVIGDQEIKTSIAEAGTNK